MTAFTIYPAIDMLGGNCVRLIQGDYSQETVYGNSPFDMAKSFAGQGAEWIHMVDLDGAKAGERKNDAFVIKAANELQAKIQIGGGIRSERDVTHYLENGIERVILGSAAVSDPAFTKDMIRRYGSRIAIGIDAKDGMAATHGWLQTSETKAVELGKALADAGAEVFIVTDIATDGMLSGPNIGGIVTMAEETGKQVIASGGISSLEDIAALREYQANGVIGAIIGKALYTNRFTVREALKRVSD
ncbi:1-(5-phosphoribosyl)-5-[(5-phosphoribosylamino)methylideneamino] imidazole-4-carboxamide isomerase [Bacillus sp. OV322]|uniref:1-(5-phosphoribosyl)-5-[(5- phosphoribosylamino)methylideneamino]imidazole-4- carboxamide isomerase n=1 Tax=Bacillus sp. OV322 TaxID=1882764 RepID=UPI0008E61F56|nr:1-(5-phosphoribosyl)-5-[(5-phosphoribosylamino)methylideneamino]imidazole-4-carboxamide isomerase [Bacillus sp. OV322]SFC26120.1 1-(5-phosphoribosyl)-5-[(5-phosphoribosylamino)methylideneamino] imidazole-4-carboxamide isomerase [Bacillus sp. OV322]